MITPKNLLSHELVGLHATILASPQTSIIGMSGTIIYETRNMLTVRTKNGIKRISKRSVNRMRLLLPFNACFIRGQSLIGRPEDRISNVRRVG
jgi:ribonuclease P protein subunit POP4